MPRRGAGNYPWSCGTLRDTIRPIRSGQCYENELANIQRQLTREREKWEKLREWATFRSDAFARELEIRIDRLDAEAKEGQR